jgi:hypothetical protein
MFFLSHIVLLLSLPALHVYSTSFILMIIRLPFIIFRSISNRVMFLAEITAIVLRFVKKKRSKLTSAKYLIKKTFLYISKNGPEMNSAQKIFSMTSYCSVVSTREKDNMCCLTSSSANSSNFFTSLQIS